MWSRALVAGLAALAVSGQRFDAGPAWKLTAAGGTYHRFVAPGAPFEVSVQLRDAEGSPVPAASVIFVVPESGFGEFSGEGERPWLRRIPVSESGSATAALIAPERESFYTVSAVAEGTTREVTFAITVTRDSPAPGWEPGDARAAAAEQLGSSSDSPGLFGPYWLPAGGEFGERGARIRGTVAEGSFFFWYDPSPQADFFHSVRYLTLPGSQPPAAPPAAVTATWWPDLRTGADSESRLQRALADGRTPIEGPGQFLPAANTAPRIRGINAGAPDGACGIIAYGPGRAFYLNSVHMKDVFENTLTIPAERLLTTDDVTLPSQLESMIARLVELRCTKLYIYLAGHGSGGAVFLGNENSQDDDTDADAVFFDSIASQLQLAAARLRREGVTLEVCLMVQSCGAGSMIAALQGKGFDGEVLTASDQSSSAYGFPLFIGSLFTYQLSQCWSSGEADTNGDGVSTLAELHACIGARFPSYAPLAQALVNSLPNPQVSRIYGDGLTIQLPAVTITQGASQEVTIPRPEWAAGELEVRIEAVNPSAATINGQGFVTITVAAGDPIRFNVNGIAAGQSNYTVRINKDAQGKTGAGTAVITVTAPVSLAPAMGTGSLLGLGSNGSAVARITRTGNLTAARTFRLTTSGDTPGTGNVALVPFDVTIPANTAAANFNVFGLRPGRSTIFATSDGETFRLPVLNPGIGFQTPIPRLNQGSPGEAAPCYWSDGTPVTGWDLALATETITVNPSRGRVTDSVQVPDLGCIDLGGIVMTPRETGAYLGSFSSLLSNPDRRQESFTGVVVHNLLADGPPAGLALSAPPAFREAGSLYSFDVAAGAANGGFVRGTRIVLTGGERIWFFNGRTRLNPNGESSVEFPAGPNGFARVGYVVPQAGPATLGIRFASGPAASVNLDAVARLAEPADYLNLLNRPEPIAVGQTGGVDFEVRRNGLPLDRAVMTCDVEGGAFEFTGGTLGRRNTLTQYTSGPAGRLRIPLRATRTGFGILQCRSGLQTQDVLIRTPFPAR